MDKIIIHYTKPIEVTINGHKYEGKDIEFKNMKIASEVTRIARQAYGPDII